MQIQLTPFPIYREQIYNILPTLVIEKSVFSTGLFIFERRLMVLYPLEQSGRNESQ